MYRRRTRPALALALALAALVSVPLTLAGAGPAGAAPAGAALAPLGSVPAVATLNAIACPTAARCVAVGADASQNGKSAVINTAAGAATVWSGSVPTHALESVACAVPTVCVATSVGIVTRVEVSNGATVKTAVVHAPAGQIAAIGDVACPSSAGCFAVGFIGTEVTSKAVVVHVSATGALLGTLEESSSSGIGAIACPAATRCLLAAADRRSPERIQLLNNGHFGAGHALAANTYVQSMACFKSVVCFAIGGKSTVGKTDELIAINPTTGAVGAVAVIPGGFSATGIACPDAGQCIVSGFSSKGKPQIVATSHGHPGAAHTVAGTGLSGIACASATACFAVGQDVAAGLVERV